MRIIFAGTPDFAIPSLKALIQSNHDVLCVLTQPDRPAGRGLLLTESPVKCLALSYELPVLQPKLLDAHVLKTLSALQADVIVVVAYGLKIPLALLNLPRLGCINIHPSLLPRYRGATPIHAAIANGDSETGVCIMKMDEGWDTGPIFRQQRIVLNQTEETTTLMKQCSEIGASLLLEQLQLDENLWRPKPQQGTLSYALKIKKGDMVIDWQQPAVTIERQIRAYGENGLHSWLQGQRINVHQVVLLEDQTTDGNGGIQWKEQGLVIRCGLGSLGLLSFTFAGKPRDFWPFKSEFTGQFSNQEKG